jgi:hypothetical protein
MNKILILSLFFLMPIVSFASWDDCPHGKTDGSCEYPGECGRYTDTNNDAICDHSQENPNKQINNFDIQVKQNLSSDELEKTTKQTAQESRQYPLFVIAALITILYGFTYILTQNKTITVLTHRKIWNGILTVVFLTTSLLGVLLILQINSGKVFNLPFDLLYWHVVTGIVMMVIALFHMGWHWKYYKNFFKK